MDEKVTITLSKHVMTVVLVSTAEMFGKADFVPELIDLGIAMLRTLPQNDDAFKNQVREELDTLFTRYCVDVLKIAEEQ